MNSNTKKLLDQVVADMNLLKKKMIFEMDSYAMATISAFLFACAGKRADIDRYVECKKYLKKYVSVFSEIRGIAQAIVITKMCLADHFWLTGDEDSAVLNSVINTTLTNIILEEIMMMIIMISVSRSIRTSSAGSSN